MLIWSTFFFVRPLDRLHLHLHLHLSYFLLFFFLFFCLSCRHTFCRANLKLSSSIVPTWTSSKSGTDQNSANGRERRKTNTILGSNSFAFFSCLLPFDVSLYFLYTRSCSSICRISRQTAPWRYIFQICPDIHFLVFRLLYLFSSFSFSSPLPRSRSVKLFPTIFIFFLFLSFVSFLRWASSRFALELLFRVRSDTRPRTCSSISANYPFRFVFLPFHGWSWRKHFSPVDSLLLRFESQAIFLVRIQSSTNLDASQFTFFKRKLNFSLINAFCQLIFI